MYQLNPAVLCKAIEECDTISRSGRVVQFNGQILESSGPDAFLGEVCEVFPSQNATPVRAEVVGFRNGHVLLAPYGSLHGVHVGGEVIATGRRTSIPVGEEYLGRVVDAFMNPIDGKGSLQPRQTYPLHPDGVNPLSRKPIDTPLRTGVKAIDCFTPVGVGQRIGIFAGSGVGKTTLLGMIAKQSTAEINVIALIGERGREVSDFIEHQLGPAGLSKSVVLVAGPDQPASVRLHAALAAFSIAEFFRDCGKHVLLIMDSITRLAMAMREIGVAAGEPPTSRGYPPSAFIQIPKLMERAGNFWNGSISAIISVLVEADDFNEPVSDHVRAILDGHIILDRKIANRGRFPSIDVLSSLSRLSSVLWRDDEKQLVRESIKLVSRYHDAKDMIEIGAYQRGTRPELDRAVDFTEKLEEQLRQDVGIVNAGDGLLAWIRQQGIMGGS